MKIRYLSASFRPRLHDRHKHQAEKSEPRLTRHSSRARSHRHRRSRMNSRMIAALALAAVVVALLPSADATCEGKPNSWECDMCCSAYQMHGNFNYDDGCNCEYGWKSELYQHEDTGPQKQPPRARRSCAFHSPTSINPNLCSKRWPHESQRCREMDEIPVRSWSSLRGALCAS
jgi:hypothetical protein